MITHQSLSTILEPNFREQHAATAKRNLERIKHYENTVGKRLTLGVQPD